MILSSYKKKSKEQNTHETRLLCANIYLQHCDLLVADYYKCRFHANYYTNFIIFG